MFKELWPFLLSVPFWPLEPWEQVAPALLCFQCYFPRTGAARDSLVLTAPPRISQMSKLSLEELVIYFPKAKKLRGDPKH